MGFKIKYTILENLHILYHIADSIQKHSLDPQNTNVRKLPTSPQSLVVDIVDLGQTITGRSFIKSRKKMFKIIFVDQDWCSFEITRSYFSVMVILLANIFIFMLARYSHGRSVLVYFLS